MDSSVAFLNCNVIDVVTGNVASSTDLVVQNSIIVAVGPGAGCAAPFKIDASGLWAIPGLIDTHVHVCDEPYQSNVQGSIQEPEAVTLLRAFRNLFESLNCGVTTVRDAGSAHARSLIVKRAIENGMAVGSTVYCCGHIITYPCGHMADYGIEVKGKEEIRQAIRRNVALGVDYIKVASDPEDTEAMGRHPDPTFTVEELVNIVSGARENKMNVACHTYPSVRGVQRAIDAGVDTIEHAVPLAGVVVPKARQSLITFVPTFVSAYDVMPLEVIMSKMSLDLCRAKLFDATNTKALFVTIPDSIAEWFDRLTANLPKAITDRSRLTIGSDAGCLGTNFRSAIREMFLLTQMGASNHQVLQFATLNAAEALGVRTIGRLEVNFTADIVFCGANPIEELEALLDIKIVVSRGTIVKLEQ